MCGGRGGSQTRMVCPGSLRSSRRTFKRRSRHEHLLRERGQRSLFGTVKFAWLSPRDGGGTGRKHEKSLPVGGQGMSGVAVGCGRRGHARASAFWGLFVSTLSPGFSSGWLCLLHGMYSSSALPYVCMKGIWSPLCFPRFGVIFLFFPPLSSTGAFG